MTKINSRNKGANGEREVAALLQTVVNEVALNCGYVAPKIRRNVEQCQIGGEDLVGLPWYSFEVKRVEKVDLDKWWLQTCTQARRKAAGSNAWDALVKGGWRKVAAGEPGTGQMGGGSMPSHEAAGVRVEAARAGSDEASVRGGQEAAPVPKQGLSLPVWAGGHGGSIASRELVIDKPFANALARVLEDPDSLPDVGLPKLSAFAGLGGFEQWQANPDSSPVTGRSELVATNTSPASSNAEKQAPMAREPVLLWRVNNRPWQVRCIVDILCIDGTTKLRPTIDLSFDSWIEVFKKDLTHRLRG